MHFIKKTAFIVSTLIALYGCAKKPEILLPMDLKATNRVITKTVSPHLPLPRLQASFGVENNDAVLKAYKSFSKKGAANSIYSQTLRTIAYDPYAHPILSCSPLHLCVVQLEVDEQIHDVELGDASDWVLAHSFVGTSNHGSYQISLKPKQNELATDLLITTDKRTYNIGLVSQAGSPSQILTFYYPEETREALRTEWQRKVKNSQAVVNTNSSQSVKQFNFDYQLNGDHPAWRPRRVFDDGNKTFIEMPAISAHVDLPILVLIRHHQQQIVNYRYQRPYYIVDALFQRALLLSGKGSHQSRVLIINQHPLS